MPADPAAGDVAGGRLILVTSHFPFGRHDAFLEAEIGHLAAAFRQVEIISFVVHDSCRAVPANVSVCRDYFDLRWGPRRRRAVTAAFAASLFSRPFWRELAERLPLSLRQPARLPAQLIELVRGSYRVRLFRSFLGPRLTPGTVVYFYWLTPEVLAATQLRDRLAAEGIAIRVVSRAHGSDLYEAASDSGYFSYRRPILAAVDRLYPISAHGLRYLAQRYPESAARFNLRRLGVLPRDFRNPQPGAGLHILSIAYLRPGKRIDRLVEAIRIVNRRLPDLQVRWTHVGDGPLRNEIGEMAAALPPGIEARLLGAMDNPAVFELLRREPFDCLVNTSESEGIPVSIMEGFSAGLPAIGPAVGGIPEILVDGAGILLDDAPTGTAIAEALLTFVDKAATAPMRERAYAVWARHYDASLNHAAFGRELAALCRPRER